MDYSEVLESINRSHRKNASRKINEIIRLFKKGINKFDYSGDSVGLSLLLDEIIIYRRSATKKERAAIDKKMSTVTDLIDEILISKPEYIKNDDPNYTEIKKIHNSLSELGLIQSKKRVKTSNQMYNFLRFIIFDSRDISLIKRIITDYPDVINSVSANGVSIAEEICHKYVMSLDQFSKTKDIKYRNNLLIYDEILRKLLVSEESKYIFTEQIQKKCLVIVDRYLSENYEIHDDSFMVWIHKIVDNLTQKERKLTEYEMELTTDIQRDFPDNVMFVVKSNSIFRPYEEELEKRNHSDEFIVTIDGEGARVLDDGLSAKVLSNGNYLLGVHITDPIGYIGPNNKLIDEAFRRTRTIYKGQPNYIFPQELRDKASLFQKKGCLVLSYYLEIDKAGNVVLDHFKIKKEVVNISKRLTFNKADEIITSNSFDQEMDRTITTLVEINNILKRRIKVSQSIEEELLSVEENESSDIVQYSMMFTNMTVANYMSKANIPFIYIANGQKDAYFEKLQAINPDNLPDRDTRGLYKQLVNYPGRSFYTTNPKQVHEALGGINYTRVTSPLIMFGDLLATSALHAFYFGEAEPEFVDEYQKRYQKMARYMNHRVKTIDYYERNYSRIKKD